MLENFRSIPAYFLQPLTLFRTYDTQDLRPDLIAGLTVAVVLLPQAIAYALIAELPPQVGLYTAITAPIVGALWGSSNHLHTGPTNAASLLLLSVVLPIASPGSEAYLAAAGLMAVMVGVMRLAMGLARLGMLVNFVSDSVIVGFTAGAGVLISINQLRHLLRLEFPSTPRLLHIVQNILLHLPDTHWPSLSLGLGTLLLIIVLRRLNPKLPGPLIGMVLAAAVVWLFHLDQQGVAVIGQLPRNLPPLKSLPLFDVDLISQLSTGALAVGAIGLVEAMSIARAIASQTNQRVDSNQEFVGQGLANIVAGFFSGYPCSGSFTRSAVNFAAGGRTRLSSIFSGLFVLLALLIFAPLAAYVPRTALAAVLIMTAYGMIDRHQILRIWQGARDDAFIMVVTFLATLLLALEFAVLAGILLSLTLYIMRTSAPRVHTVLPDDEFRHLLHRSDKPQCPQMSIIDIHGDLYFGAVSHVESAIFSHISQHPHQRFLLLRLHGVNLCDFSGIHMLESVVRSYRERHGDVYMMRVRQPVLEVMQATGFYEYLGADHFLSQDDAIDRMFYRVLDPATCIYECEVRAFEPCQNLPKRLYPIEIPEQAPVPETTIQHITPQELWEQMHSTTPPLVIDVREVREYQQGHVPLAELHPLHQLLTNPPDLPRDRLIVLTCRSGRRSKRAACTLLARGYENVAILEGGILAWKAAGLLEALGSDDKRIQLWKFTPTPT